MRSLNSFTVFLSIFNLRFWGPCSRCEVFELFERVYPKLWVWGLWGLVQGVTFLNPLIVYVPTFESELFGGWRSRYDVSALCTVLFPKYFTLRYLGVCVQVWGLWILWGSVSSGWAWGPMSSKGLWHENESKKDTIFTWGLSYLSHIYFSAELWKASTNNERKHPLEHHRTTLKLWMSLHGAVLRFDPCDRLLWELKPLLNTGSCGILGRLTLGWVTDNQEVIWALLLSRLCIMISGGTAQTKPREKSTHLTA